MSVLSFEIVLAALPYGYSPMKLSSHATTFTCRTIADIFLLQVGVVAVPEVTEYYLTPKDEFLLLASDGVWEFIDNQEASIERTSDDFLIQ